MKFGKDIAEPQFTPFPKGQYPGKITKTEATTSKSSGTSMISLELEINNDQGEVKKLFDNIITDGSSKGAYFAKAKFRALGVPDNLLDADEETPDEVIAQNLLGMNVLVTVGIEPMTEQNPLTGKWDKQKTYVDPSGKEIPSFRNVVKGYALPSEPTIAVHVPQVPAQQAAPRAPAPVQQVPVQQAPAQQLPNFAPQSVAPAVPGGLPWAQGAKSGKAAAANAKK